MPRNLTQKLVESHLVRGRPVPGEEIAIAVDQTLTQDATGTLVMLELEALGLDRVRTELSVQYVDHNLLQTDFKNPDDHLFLQSACERFGLWYSRPGNGVSHVVHQEHFGAPGRTLLGSDSHTCAAGALGMLAVGTGGLDVAMAMAGEPYGLAMPEVWGIELEGSLPAWVSAKDVILELLRRHGVAGGVGRVLEYHGPGLDCLRVMDRHVIANMGAELGATTSVFPADEAVRAYLRARGREDAFEPLAADEGASYDRTERIDLSTLEPLVAKPSSPGDVVPVREVAGTEISQAYVGSSANPGFRDFAVVAEIVRDHRVPASVSLDVNPSSRWVLQALVASGHLGALLQAGARLHQAGCNGCIGMGQAPATGRNSLRTVPRNFPGRSGTPEDSVWLASPETAAASALAGAIADPRGLDREPPVLEEPEVERDGGAFVAPLPPDEARRVELVKGPNVGEVPDLEPVPERLELPVLLALGDDVSTDEILPAGAEVLPLRSNVAAIARHAFRGVDAGYPERADGAAGGHAIVAGRNYGQGSSREHAALALRHLGLRAVVARSFARIHRRNLINFGVVPLLAGDGDLPARDEVLVLEGLREGLERGRELELRAGRDGRLLAVRHDLSPEELEILLAGGRIGRREERERTRSGPRDPGRSGRGEGSPRVEGEARNQGEDR